MSTRCGPRGSPLREHLSPAAAGRPTGPIPALIGAPVRSPSRHAGPSFAGPVGIRGRLCLSSCPSGVGRIGGDQWRSVVHQSDCETNPIRQKTLWRRSIRRGPRRASVPPDPPSFPAHPWESAVVRACPLNVWRACPLNVWRACPLDVWRVHPPRPVVVGVGRRQDRWRSVVGRSDCGTNPTRQNGLFRKRIRVAAVHRPFPGLPVGICSLVRHLRTSPWSVPARWTCGGSTRLCAWSLGSVVGRTGGDLWSAGRTAKRTQFVTRPYGAGPYDADLEERPFPSVRRRSLPSRANPPWSVSSRLRLSSLGSVVGSRPPPSGLCPRSTSPSSSICANRRNLRTLVVAVSRWPDRWRSVTVFAYGECPASQSSPVWEGLTGDSLLICGSPARLRNEPNSPEDLMEQVYTTRPEKSVRCSRCVIVPCLSVGIRRGPCLPAERVAGLPAERVAGVPAGRVAGLRISVRGRCGRSSAGSVEISGDLWFTSRTAKRTQLARHAAPSRARPPGRARDLAL
jgi:hypothetical protein